MGTDDRYRSLSCSHGGAKQTAIKMGVGVCHWKVGTAPGGLIING